VSTPEQLREQHNERRLEALQKGREVRARDKEIRRMFKERRVSAIDALAGRLPASDLHTVIAESVASWKVETAIRAVPGIGPTIAHDVMGALPVSPRTRLGTLSFERRAALADLCEAARQSK
jgi:hypothetical protein